MRDEEAEKSESERFSDNCSAYEKARREEGSIRKQEAAAILDLMQRRMDLLRLCLTTPQPWGTPWPPQFVADELAWMAQSLRKFIWLQAGEG